MTRTITAVCAATALIFGIACKKKSADKQADPLAGSAAAGKTATATADKAKATPKPPTPTEATATKVRGEVTALMAGWRDAQNQGNFTNYRRLYHPHFFRGVKRTTSGKVARLDYKGWLADRGRMFKKKVEVATDDIDIRTWLDSDSKLKPGVSAVRFTQRWKSGTYADHGIKIVHVWRDTKGRQRIVYEDLVNAERGWDREVKKLATMKIAPPKTDAEALAVWKSLGISGANYTEKLAALPDDEVTLRALARTLIAGGNFECTAINEYDECGEDYSEWEPLEPKATFDDPCLRRRLADWSLEQINGKDAEELAGQLAAMAGIKGPSDDLVASALTVALETSPDVAALVAAAANAAEHTEPLETTVGASEDVVLLIALYDEGVALAGQTLAGLVEAEGPHTNILLKIVTDNDVDDDTRVDLVGELEVVQKSGVAAALAEVATHDNCELSMAAAEALAERGDKTALPSQAGATVKTAPQILCRLLAGSSEYAGAEADKFFPKEGVELTETVETETYPEYDDDGNEIEEEEEEEEEPTTSMIDRSDFEALDPYNDESITFSFGADEKGRVVLSTVDQYTYHGCGC